MATKKKTASKSAQKKGSTGKRSERASQAAPPDCPALVRQLEILSGRVADLMAASLELDEVARARGQIAASGTQDAARQVAVGFKKTSGPAFVSIKLLDRNEGVLSPSATEGTSQPRSVGAEIDAAIVVKGNFGQEAVIEVTNAIPRTIRMSPFPGETGNQGTRRLVVVG